MRRTSIAPWIVGGALALGVAGVIFQLRRPESPGTVARIGALEGAVTPTAVQDMGTLRVGGPGIAPTNWAVGAGISPRVPRGELWLTWAGPASASGRLTVLDAAAQTLEVREMKPAIEMRIQAPESAAILVFKANERYEQRLILEDAP